MLVRGSILPLIADVPPTADVQQIQKAKDNAGSEMSTKSESELRVWELPLPFVPQCVLKSGNRLYVSGGLGKDVQAGIATDATASADRTDQTNKRGRKKPASKLSPPAEDNAPVLWVVDARSGARLASYDLPAPPAFDGMAAAAARLYVSLTDGSIVCFGNN